MGRNTRFNVISNGNYSKTLKARGGVQQGGTLSPSEYNILIDTLCDKLEEALNAPNATGTIKTADGGTLGGLLFADDVALFTTNPYTLQSLISICEEHSRTWGYRWKPGKSKIVQKPGPTPAQFTIYGEAMGSTPMFTYLGCPFDAYGINASALIHKNIGAMRAAAHEMTLLGVNGSGFSTYRSVLAWKSFVRPCLEYGLALVTLTKKLRKSLEKAHMMGLRMAIGGYKRSSIEAMRQLCKAEPMEVRCQESQLRWICHALQAPTTSLVRKILPDALNDQSSPLRKLADSSEMWRHLPGRDLPMGPALPSLWTESERAAIAFRLAEHRRPQWNFQQSDEAEAGGDSFTNAQSLVVTKEYLIGKRKQLEEDRRNRSIETDTNILARDLPPVTSSSSPLELTQWPLADRRRLLCWFIGAFPSHREQNCLVCGDPIPTEGGGRAHVAWCITLNYPELGLVTNPSELPDESSRQELRRRKASTDPITLTIWKAHSLREWQASTGEQIRKALQLVSALCLGRDSAEPPDPP